MPTLTPRIDAVDRPNIRSSEGSGTTTLSSADSLWQIFNLSAARTAVLPSVGIAAGQILTLENIAEKELIIASSDLTTMTLANVHASSAGDPTIYRGRVILCAMQAAPTAPGHWRVVEVFEEFTLSGTPVVASGGGTYTSSSGSVKFSRHNTLATVYARYSGTVGGTVNGVRILGLAPARFRPTAILVYGPVGQGSQAVGITTGAQQIQIYNTGDVTIWNLIDFIGSGGGLTAGANTVSAGVSYSLPITP